MKNKIGFTIYARTLDRVFGVNDTAHHNFAVVAHRAGYPRKDEAPIGWQADVKTRLAAAIAEMAYYFGTVGDARERRKGKAEFLAFASELFDRFAAAYLEIAEEKLRQAESIQPEELVRRAGELLDQADAVRQERDSQQGVQ